MFHKPKSASERGGATAATEKKKTRQKGEWTDSRVTHAMRHFRTKRRLTSRGVGRQSKKKSGELPRNLGIEQGEGQC